MSGPRPRTATAARLRWAYLAIAVSTIPIGLIARSLRGQAGNATAQGFVATYLGDTLWAVMFFFYFAALLPRWRAWRLALLTLLVTLGIEGSQLYHGEPLKTLRSFPLVRFLIGTHFLWSDVACLIVGAVLAVAAHTALPKPDQMRCRGPAITRTK